MTGSAPRPAGTGAWVQDGSAHSQPPARLPSRSGEPPDRRWARLRPPVRPRARGSQGPGSSVCAPAAEAPRPAGESLHRPNIIPATPMEPDDVARLNTVNPPMSKNPTSAASRYPQALAPSPTSSDASGGFNSVMKRQEKQRSKRTLMNQLLWRAARPSPKASTPKHSSEIRAKHTPDQRAPSHSCAPTLPH